MTIDDSFDVDAPIDKVWPLLQDVPKVASCIPNAEITEVVNATTYKAKVKVKAGPAAVDYKATIYVEEMDNVTHTARLRVQGDESRGRGGIKATVVSQATDIGGKTHVTLHTEAQISGIVATIGGRLIEGVAKKTVAEFAANLANLL
jgi:carbon monoxide dehydrogenase subunit G